MPVYQLINEVIFPPPCHAEPDGLLAVGGDLSPERLLLAYASGVFPWYSDNDPILWWSPDPRFILYPNELKVSRSLEKTIRKGKFEVTIDRDFDNVITNCAQVRVKKGEGTWITDDMRSAYCHLHEMGYAHSVESWHNGILVGGLYGVSLGRCFFGESMFSLMTDASKVAFVSLGKELAKRDFELIDCQMPSDHLISFGARGIGRDLFIKGLEKGGVNPAALHNKGDFPVCINDKKNNEDV
ncbi:MAG: leucyl/phenylalanyl-tRNA--protein transferase [Proteobacteria bacterium]|nr:leucyl/phenylalanyl-tRNA--protein transferase [Pseudomonadota bacterium]